MKLATKVLCAWENKWISDDLYAFINAFINLCFSYNFCLQADFIAHNLELHHSFTVGTNNTTLVRDTDFTYQFYERAYEVRLGNKSLKSKEKHGTLPDYGKNDTEYKSVPDNPVNP